MKTSYTSAVATLVLVTATGAMAASPNADPAQPLTREAVIADLVASRQAAPTLPPRDGEWYNAPAPLGHMDPTAPMARQVRQEDTGSTRAMPDAPAVKASHIQ